MVGKHQRRRGEVEHEGDGQAAPADPRLGVPRRVERLDKGDRRAECIHDVAADERDRHAEADAEARDQGGGLPRRPHVEAAIAGAEKRLIDHAGLEQTGRGRERQDAAPARAAPAGQFAHQQSRRTVERREDQEAAEHRQGAAGRVVVGGQVLAAHRGQHEQHGQAGAPPPAVAPGGGI
jgi:hypothetical protein